MLLCDSLRSPPRICRRLLLRSPFLYTPSHAESRASPRMRSGGERVRRLIAIDHHQREERSWPSSPRTLNLYDAAGSIGEITRGNS
eukprot:scaffold1305_cov374-Prasinococcus_capsulatus_cf.AAC.3